MQKQADKNGEDSHYARQGLVTIQTRLNKDIFHSHMEIITLDQAVIEADSSAADWPRNVVWSVNTFEYAFAGSQN